MSNIILVHGIHGKSHKGGIYMFGKELEKLGYTCRYFAYPSRWALSMYFPWKKREDGQALAAFMQNGDHVIAHSNGCLVFQQSILAGAKWDKCMLFGGAATSDKFDYPADALNSARVIYNPSDKALMAGAKMPFHPFGKLGLRGYFGQPSLKPMEKDERFLNINGHVTGSKLNHSHYFAEPYRNKWLKMVVEYFGESK